MSGSEYSLRSYGQFEKMTFFPPDPLSVHAYRLGIQWKMAQAQQIWSIIL
jgi:hypothetical protein